MTQTMTRTEVVERAIDRPTAGAIGISMTGGLSVRDMAQAMEVAKLMAVSGQAVPAHLRNNPGACLAIAIQGWEWAVNPFAIANKSYVVNDRLGYESSLYHAVVLRRAPILGRLKIEYRGEGQTRQCRITARLCTDDAMPDTVDYDSPRIGDIKPQNSPLWKNDPDQQLFYFSVRAFTRRHFPDVMMGVYTADELRDTEEIGREPTMMRHGQNADDLNKRLAPKEPTLDTTDAQAPLKQPQNPPATAKDTTDIPQSETVTGAGGPDFDADAYSPLATIEQVEELAARHAPTDLESPDAAVELLRVHLRTAYSKPWAKMAEADRHKVWDSIVSGEFFTFNPKK